MRFLLAATQPQLDYGQVVVGILTNPLVWVTLITSFAIPILNAALTSVRTIPIFKAFVTAFLAGMTALVEWLTGLGGAAVDWKVALGVFATAAAGAGGVHAGIIKGPIADKISNAVPVNMGPKIPVVPQTGSSAATPERNLRYTGGNGVPPT